MEDEEVRVAKEEAIEEIAEDAVGAVVEEVAADYREREMPRAQVANLRT